MWFGVICVSNKGMYILYEGFIMAFKDYFKEFKSLKVNDDIILRQVDVNNDLSAFINIYSDSDAFKFYQGYRSKPSAQQVPIILNNGIKGFQKANSYGWTITKADENIAIGSIHLNSFENNNTCANIGYFLAREYWGEGIISACISPVVEFGFNNLKLERIYSTIETSNIASWRALEKNGFKREGLMRHCFVLMDGLHDCFMYSRLFTD